MKILLISLARRGGMVHYSIEHAKSISTICQVFIITSLEVPIGTFDSKVRHFQINTGKKKLGTLLNAFNPKIYSKIATIASSIKPDLVHITAKHEWNPLVAWLIRKYLNLPLVYTVFDPTPHEGASLYFEIPEMLVRKIPDAYIVQTQWLKEDFVSKGYQSQKTHVIQLGAYSAITQWKKEDIQEKNEILFFGRLELYKGLDVLLSAAPLVLKKLSGWRFVIAGRGDFNPYQKMIASDQIIIINRFIEDQEAAALFQRAKLVVLPYLSATSTGVIPLAYAFATPVVSTDVGGLGAVVEHNKTGLLIPPKDPEALAQAILSIIKDEDFRKYLGENALAYSNEKLSWSSFAQAHMAVYKEVIEGFL